jgi:ribosome-associated protein
MTASSSHASDKLLALILSSLEDDKAEDVTVIDLKGKSEMADFMVVASGRSSRQVGAISEKLVDRVKQAGLYCGGGSAAGGPGT